MRRSPLTLKIFLLIIVTDIVESLAELFMKSGLNYAGITQVTWSNFAETLSWGIASPLIWAGVVFYILNFFVWIAVLSRVQLSVAFPLGSTCYIYVPILAMIFLHETVTPLRWAGIALIVLGIKVVSKSGQEHHHNHA